MLSYERDGFLKETTLDAAEDLGKTRVGYGGIRSNTKAVADWASGCGKLYLGMAVE
jgi:hypothetical protein